MFINMLSLQEYARSSDSHPFRLSRQKTLPQAIGFYFDRLDPP